MNHSFIRRINFGLGASLLLLLLNAIVAYRNINLLTQNQQQVDQSLQRLLNLERTLSILKDAETGQRGYLLTGEESYLKPYQNAVAQVNQQIGILQQLTTNTPTQQNQIRSLETAINAKLAELQQTITLRQTQGSEAALKIVRTDQGKQLMDNIRQQVAALEAGELQHLTERSQQSQASVHQTLLTFLLVNGLSLLLLLLVAVLFQRNEIQRRQAELALRESEQQFKGTFNQAAVGIAHVGLNGSWLLVNQKLCDIVGYSYAELIEQTFQDITYPADLRIDFDYIRRMLAGEIQTYSMEKRYIRRDGSLTWVNLTVSLVRDPNGDPDYFISVIQDINARKQAEAEIQRLNVSLEQRVEQRTAELQEANEALEAFSYSVSHDLRAPLRTLQGFAQALVEDYGDQFDQMGQQYIQFITEGAMQMDTLIGDLLDYSRLSRTQIQLEPVDLQQVIEAVLRQLDGQLCQTDVRIDTPLPQVQAHRATLMQVLTNLIVNASKFVKSGVQPKLHIYSEEYVERSQNWVRLWVEDNGIGIAPEHQERIFRVFERLHGAETYPGTGIGLAIVRKGLERMGGHAGVKSQLGQGSRFWIALPKAVLVANGTPHDTNDSATPRPHRG